jgi:hypothetical protein
LVVEVDDEPPHARRRDALEKVSVVCGRAHWPCAATLAFRPRTISLFHARDQARSGPSVGTTFPGFMIPLGSKSCLMPR